jgi:hypothetical protein
MLFDECLLLHAVCHYITRLLVELYEGCMAVLKVPWCGIIVDGGPRQHRAALRRLLLRPAARLATGRRVI